MNEFDGETPIPPRRPPTTHVAFGRLLAVSFGVLLAAAAFPAICDTVPAQSGTKRAAAIVGVVLVEAIALDVGYGALAAIVEPSVREALGGDTTWNSSE